MGLARFVPPQRVALPHEPGQWVEIKKLNGRQLRKVRKAAQLEAFQTMRDMGAEMLTAVQSIDADAAESAARALQRNPLQGYDVDLLLEMSVVGWSYDLPVDADTIADLDDDTIQVIGEAAVAFSARQRTEADTKND